MQFAVCAVIFAVTIPLSWRYRTAGGPKKFVRNRFEIPLRALAVAVVVAAVTTASSVIGPFASGMLALFPIILGSSIAIMHPRIGGKATASMAAHAQVFLIGIALGGWRCTIWSLRSGCGWRFWSRSASAWYGAAASLSFGAGAA